MVDYRKPIPIVNLVFRSYHINYSFAFIGYCRYLFSQTKHAGQPIEKKNYSHVYYIPDNHTVGTISASYYITNVIAGVDRSFIIKTLFETELPSALKYYSFFALMASVFFFFKIWQEAIDREQQLREENLKYKYRTLKTQVNPHFLFNSLNTLSELIYTDAKRADNYTQKLAKIYRYILENEETDLIPLNEELDFVKQYFDLQKERNGDKIQLDIRIENPNNFKIIPISLQILVENALKHNSASKEKPLTIYIYDDDGYIIVSNNIQRKSTLNTSSGTGLDNLQQRTKLITGKDVILTQHNLFIVKLPIIKQSQ